MSLTCTLPPTCRPPHKPTKLSSVQDVEEHYAKYHTHVCESKGCRAVFPDERFLELHFAECHDPILALKRERGEKTFACFLSSCKRRFATPKGRRLHLIQIHNYPKQFFFAVTNKGISGLLHRWGPGASLVRDDWKPRMKNEEMHDGHSDSGNDVKCVMDAEEGDDPHADAHSPSSSASMEIDTLAHTMSSLSLVPDKIRFGRGGKKGGFSHFQHPKSSRRPNGDFESGEQKGRSNGSRLAWRNAKLHDDDQPRQRLSSAEVENSSVSAMTDMELIGTSS